jgi:ABC-type sugar transport system ATPase subunit
MSNDAQREPILNLTNIHKAFGGVQALVGAHFELRPGG